MTSWLMIIVFPMALWGIKTTWLGWIRSSRNGRNWPTSILVMIFIITLQRAIGRNYFALAAHLIFGINAMKVWLNVDFRLPVSKKIHNFIAYYFSYNCPIFLIKCYKNSIRARALVIIHWEDHILDFFSFMVLPLVQCSILFIGDSLSH